MPVSKQKTSTNQNAWAKLKQHMKTEPRYVPALAYGHIKISTPRRSFFKRWVLGKKEKEYTNVLEFGERLDLVLWETCHIYATCQAYRAEADFQHSPTSKRTEYAGPNGPIGLIP